MKKLLLLVVGCALLVATGEAQFKANIRQTLTMDMSVAPVAYTDTTYTGTFAGYFGFLAVTGVNVDKLYQGEVNVRRGFDDGSYINIFLSTPAHADDPQIVGVGYGKLLTQPLTDTWLFLNAAALYSKANKVTERNYVGIPVGLELKWDFTPLTSISARVDGMPAYNFESFGAAVIGRVALSVNP